MGVDSAAIDKRIMENIFSVCWQLVFAKYGEKGVNISDTSAS